MTSTLLTVQRPPSFIKTALACVGAVALIGAAVAGTYHCLRTDSSDDVAAAMITMAQHTGFAPLPSAVPPDYFPNLPAPAVFAAPAQTSAPTLYTAMVLDGRRLDPSDSIALHSGSAFILSLASDHSGHAHVYAINPDGQSRRIWSSRMRAQQVQQTPALHLQGQRGYETLRIVFVPDAGGYGERTTPVVRQINILHL